MAIFVSYSRADRGRVNCIAKGLIAESYEIWWDRDNRAGEEFDQQPLGEAIGRGPISLREM